MKEHDLIERLARDGELVTERLEHWAARIGARTAVYYGEDDVTVSFAELAERARSIAGNLAAAGIGKGERVSVFSTNPLVSTFLMYGIWRAGALYCPVNFAYSGRLLTYQLDDTAPVLVITDGKLLPALNEVFPALLHKPRVCVYEAPPGAHDHVPDDQRTRLHLSASELSWSTLVQPAAPPDVHITVSDAANVIYTSGTTGAAKGVVQPHRWLNQYSLALRFNIGETDVVYNDLPLYHVGGAIANVVRAMWMGAECAIWDRFSPTDFWRRIEKRKATAAILLDVMIPWLMKAPESPTDRSNTLNKVHMQPLPLHHHAVSKRFGFDFVTAGFGQTESGAPVWCLLEEVPDGEGTPADVYRGFSHEEMYARARELEITVVLGAKVTKKGLMGRPTAFVEVSVRDDTDDECAAGTVGQLALRPKVPHMFLREYLGKPQATVNAFRNLWFHTGDAAVQDDDGLYYFVDRLGDRMRVRGENLSSFQVEDLLNQHEHIQFSAVLAIPSSEGDEDDIVAFVVATPGATLDEEAVHAYALATLPKFMRPRHVRLIADLPRTPTNKVEKYRLRQQILAELAGQAQQGGAKPRGG